MKGEVYSYTELGPDLMPEGAIYNFGCVVLAMIRLENGEMITAQLTDLESELVEKEMFFEEKSVGMVDVRKPRVWIGMEVEGVDRLLRKDSVIGDSERGALVYGYKFRPVIKPVTEEEK